VKSFADIATHLVSIGPWRATVTDYDWEYVETVQAGGGGNTGGGHATGGALSMLYHQQLGPVLAASMNQYSLIEISNQQQFTDKPHMCTTPRIELVADGKTYTSLVDLKAKLTMKKFPEASPEQVAFVAEGSLLTTSHQPVAGEGLRYQLTYTISNNSVVIAARVLGAIKNPIRLIVPVIKRQHDAVTKVNPFWMDETAFVQVTAGGDALHRGFERGEEKHTFNLVPGFECAPYTLLIEPGKEATVTLSIENAYTTP
jgi:hypothetical protein